MRLVNSLLIFSLFLPKSTSNIVREGPPHMEQFQKDKLVYFITGRTLKFPCVASGGNMTYDWLKNGKRISRTSKATNGALTISSTSSQSAGTYKCLAYNSFGRTFSEEIVVKQAKLSVISGNISYWRSQRSYIKLASYNISIPMAKVIWYKSNKPLNLSKTAVLDYNGNLYLTYIQSSDEGDYYCKVNNGYSPKTQGGIYTLKVRSRNYLLYKGLIWSSNKRTFLVGETLYLKCIFHGTNNPIIWTVTSSRKRGNNSQSAELKLTKLTTGDAAKPKWINKPNSLWLYSGDTARFVCKANGIPSPKTSWYINDVPIQKWQHPVRRSSRFSYNSSQITITDVKVEDMMSIQCVCSNTYGHVLDDVYLQINDYKMSTTTISKSSTKLTSKSLATSQTTTNENTLDVTFDGKGALTTAETATHQYGLFKEEQSEGSGNTAMIGGISGVIAALAIISIVIFIVCWYRRKSRLQNEEPVTDGFTNQAYCQTENHDIPASYETISRTSESPNTSEPEHVYCGLYKEAAENVYIEVDKIADTETQDHLDEDYAVIDKVEEQIGVSAVQPINYDDNYFLLEKRNDESLDKTSEDDDENYFLVEKEENETNNDEINQQPLNIEDDYFLLEENHGEGPMNDEKNHDKDNETEPEQENDDVDQNYFILETMMP